MSDARPDPKRFDLIVIGGGVHGMMVAHEAVGRGLRPLVVERDRIGAATTANHFRIIHGGLRQLQFMDLRRAREFAREQAWWLESFPDFVEPLPCLMLLRRGDGRSPFLFRAALLANDWLAPSSVRGRARVLGPEEARASVPLVRQHDLLGAALWHDALLRDPAAWIAEVCRRAESGGARFLEGVEVGGLAVESDRIAGVHVSDRAGGNERILTAEVVINAAGPWCRSLAARLAPPDHPELFRPLLAWNAVFDREPLGDHAIAVRGPQGGHTYFLHAEEGSLFVGTGHAAWNAGPDGATPDAAQLAAFVADVNAALPGLALSPDQITRVLSGLLPAHGATTAPARHDVIVNHGRTGGPPGFWSVSGVKFTTARLAAERVLAQAFPE